MPERRDPPPTDEGWYALHDFRTIDWDAWRSATERERRRALTEAVDFFDATCEVSDAEAGESALYSILGHKADFLVLHLRPSSAHIGALERQFERTEFARFTERTTSFVSVTEASGYSENARDYFTGDLDEDSGLYNYIQTRLKPTIPDATHVCFYPMDKRRQPEQNWYDLPFEERADHMESHGDIGREYGGKVVQMITGAIALDDWEWGVTLWGDDLVDMKDLLYEMRFDPSTAEYAEFGSFYVGRRFPPSDLPALLSGEAVPTDGAVEGGVDAAGPIHPAETTANGGQSRAGGDHAHAGEDHSKYGHGGDAHDHAAEAGHAHGASDDHAHGSEGHPTEDDESDHGEEADDGHAGGPPTGGESTAAETDSLGQRLVTIGLREGEDYDAGDYGVVLYSTADAQELAEEVDGLRENFDHYDTHVGTVVRAESGHSAVASIWDNQRAAETAEGFLGDLPSITEAYKGPLGDGADGETESETADAGEHAAGGANDIREQLEELDIYAGQPHGEDVYALVLYSDAELSTLTAEVDDLADGFDRYDTHEGTHVYEDPDSDAAAVVSLWETADAAETASDYLAELPDVVGWADEGEGFSTMGMFYTVKPEYREEFVETFDTVGEMLAEMDGHRSTALLRNTDDENDMFIASQWDKKEDAMQFFRSSEFAETVEWGQDVLADKPRHVFLA